jgi:hypothetical protein
MTTPANSLPSKEDVLYAFAMEATSGRETLEQYLRDYPRYAAELIDLSYELSCEVDENEMPLSAEDQALIDSAWERHAEALPNEIVDPLMSMSVAQQKELAQILDIPRQVILAFRERRVDLTSVPIRFLDSFASMANSTVEIMFSSGTKLSPNASLSNSYKADDRPTTQTSITSITFEQLLIEANVSPEKLALLMQDESQDG